VSLSVLNKTATRLPEAMFVSFVPEGVESSTVFVGKLGEWVNVNGTIAGGSQTLHAVDQGVRFQVRPSHASAIVCTASV
jgi:hypothetical protein